MSSSSKFDFSSTGPDRPLYSTGQRGSNLAAQLERSGSFRESMDNQVLSSLPNMLRSSSASTQGDVSSFFQCLRFDPKVVAADHKSIRQGDFKRHINVALGMSADDSPAGSSKAKLLPSPIPEEIKRVKAGLREVSVKARERVKTFNESLSVFNKFFSNIPSKKRSRPEGFSSDRPNTLSSSERSIMGPGLGKMGIPNQAMTSGFELEQQKSEERPKKAVPNKRTRTFLMDVRSNALVRPAAVVNRDKEISRLANSSVQGEDLSMSVDGWEKTTKMKKKRSGIKADGSPSMASNRSSDGFRETKHGVQQRPVSDGRSRLNNDSNGFRLGGAGGSVGLGKSDSILQQTGLTVRSSVPKVEMDHNAHPGERRDRPFGLEKERVNLRAVNKVNSRDEFNSASANLNPKGNASIRGPRSGSGVAPKLSHAVHGTTAPSDWEISNCTNKPPTATGVSSRKRTATNRSSSPPVAHWAGQRPQKISRIARRTNFVPLGSNNDESLSVDTTSDAAGTETGLGFRKRTPGNSPQQVKLKSDNMSSAALSESEESGTAEVKSKYKGKKSDEVDEKNVHVQKVSAVGVPLRKSKLGTGEEVGDGVRRQGRTGRNFASSRSMMPTVEKLSNIGTAKQLRSARLGFEKTENKAGRPPTRKLSGRKAYKRQKHTAAASAQVGFHDDGHEELLAAVTAVINSGRVFSSAFWREMETFFRVMNDADIVFLKQQGDLECTAPTTIPIPIPSNINGRTKVVNGYGLIEEEIELGLPMDVSNADLFPDPLVSGTGEDTTIPLYQRFMAALIPEDEYSTEDEGLKVDELRSSSNLDSEWRSNGADHMVGFGSVMQMTFNSHRMNGNLEHEDSEAGVPGLSNKGINLDYSSSGVIIDHTMMPTRACSQLQYDSMSINERLLLEAESIGIFLEPQPKAPQLEDEPICEDIKQLEEKYYEQVTKKKSYISKLLQRASETKELQEKEFDQRAYEKLVGIAYEKYLACRRHHSAGLKSSNNRLTKQAAMAFIKRTIDWCRQYEETGISSFNEPVFRDMFMSGFAQSSDTPAGGELRQVYANAATSSMDASLSASMASHPSPSSSRLRQNVDSFVNSFDMLPPVNCFPEETTGKDDALSTRVKKRELLLDDVGGMVGISSSSPSQIAGSLPNSMKGKRSERDREGKGHSREVISRSGTNKIGRPALSNPKGERKSKVKPKQKTTQVNGNIGKLSEQPKTPTTNKKSESSLKETNEFSLLDDLQIPEGDVLGGPDDLGSEAQDLGTWLNIDDDVLQDNDFMGLQIPMDDLSDLNMMV